MTIEQKLQALIELQETMACLKNEEATLKLEIQKHFEDDIKVQLAVKDEPYGTVNCQVSNYKIKFDRPKRVLWDQSALATLNKQIMEGGENPTDYITVEYSVSEAKYKSWPQAIKDAFIEARTVKDGAISVKVEVV